MKHATVIEGTALFALSFEGFVTTVSKFDMSNRKKNPFYICSLDKVAWIELAVLAVEDDYRKDVFSVKIKDGVAASILDKAIINFSEDFITFVVGNNTFKTIIPQQHAGQIV